MAEIGSGPYGGLTPSDFATAYNLQGPTVAGPGQTLALLELADYSATDIAFYQNFYGIGSIAIQKVLVDGGVAGRRQSSNSEVTIDIELQMALAPPGSSILVY